MSKSVKLILSIIFYAIGMISYLFPIVGETLDIVWAPISGILMFSMYGGAKGVMSGMFSALEEASPGMDLIPTFTLVWLWTYVWQKDKNEVEEIEIS